MATSIRCKYSDTGMFDFLASFLAIAATAFVVRTVKISILGCFLFLMSAVYELQYTMSSGK